jgi:hypothetical protein
LDGAAACPPAIPSRLQRSSVNAWLLSAQVFCDWRECFCARLLHSFAFVIRRSITWSVGLKKGTRYLQVAEGPVREDSVIALKLSALPDIVEQ